MSTYKRDRKREQMRAKSPKADELASLAIVNGKEWKKFDEARKWLEGSR
jgi:hypothetical protein